MERDFSNLLDSETFEGYVQNIERWAGSHGSEAVDAVAEQIWKELHEDEPIEEIEPGIVTVEGQNKIRESSTGQFRSSKEAEAIVVDTLTTETLEAALEAILEEFSG